MALKIKFQRVQIDIVPDGSATGVAFCQIRDDAALGKLGAGVAEIINFSPTFPMTKASLRQSAIDAITAKYTGAIEE